MTDSTPATPASDSAAESGSVSQPLPPNATLDEGAWVRSWSQGIDYIEHLNGVDWADAPLPRRLHRCSAQTRGWTGLTYIERCACGAVYISGGWTEKNSTRKSRRKAKR